MVSMVSFASSLEILTSSIACPEMSVFCKNFGSPREAKGGSSRFLLLCIFWNCLFVSLMLLSSSSSLFADSLAALEGELVFACFLGFMSGT